MKKFMLVLAVAGFAVACNNAGEDKKAEDTTVTTPVEPTPAPQDTVTMPQDTTAAGGDTTAK